MNESKFKEKGYFEFPFKPYDIQENFMKHLYYTIENEKIGIFESPTGTGKSLSLICGALTWLRDYEAQKVEETKNILSGSSSLKESKDEEDNEPAWVDDYFQQKAANDLIEKVKEREEKRKKQKLKLEDIRKDKRAKKRKRDDCPSIATSIENDVVEKENDDDALLVDYTSDNEDVKGKDSTSEEDEVDEEEQLGMKIFYCSRTHSQLAQFIHEVQKSPFADKIRVVALASRQTYCINEDVQMLKSGHKINEKCLDMQKKKKEKEDEKVEGKQVRKKRKKEKASGCPYYNYKRFKEFKDHAVVDVHDIEQLVSLGKDLDTCPYYGTRHSIPEAQLVVLPYQTLLHKSTRDAVGINLKGNVVIIDEGHNLIETINTIHSVEITALQISSSVNQLMQYRDRYRTRLKAKNLLYIEQILFVLNSLLSALKEKSDLNQSASSLKTINNFVYSSKIDNVNLFKIRRYCEKSQIGKKLNGFVDKFQNMEKDSTNAIHSSQFVYIEAFLDALTNADKDGRILITKNNLPSKSTFKFLLLNPAVHFIEVLQECKAVIVAGGTMQPISEFRNVLLYSANVHSERIVEFSCGHVIPPENLIALSLCKGPSSIDYDFTFQNRSKYDLIDELGRLLCNICTVVPGGVVCFFASYDYEDLVYKRWLSCGILKKIELRKKIFREPRKSGSCDKVLLDYTNSIRRGVTGGALLLSVVGGKMSEGINFSDDLGRCIIMVGLPYPNIQSPELKEKMEFLNKSIGPSAGQEHYENICMKAVNQSIGRAIRHKEDYASIILVDQRYSKPNVQNKLPSWIRSQLQCHSRFGPAFASISKFFAGKRIKS